MMIVLISTISVYGYFLALTICPLQPDLQLRADLSVFSHLSFWVQGPLVENQKIKGPQAQLGMHLSFQQGPNLIMMSFKFGWKDGPLLPFHFCLHSRNFLFHGDGLVIGDVIDVHTQELEHCLRLGIVSTMTMVKSTARWAILGQWCC